VHVLTPGADPRGLAQRISERAPAIFRQVSQRLDLPSPSPVTIVVVESPPRTLSESRRLGLHDVPAWAAGVANANRNRIVLFAARMEGYPHHDLEGLLAHEASHLLLGAAARGRDHVPRWFDEGLAMTVEREQSVTDALQLARLGLFHDPFPLAELDRSWPRDGSSARLAYAQSLDVVSMAGEYTYSGAPRRLAEGLAHGHTFERAFESAYGLHPRVLEQLWRDRLRARWWRLPLFVLGGLLNAAMGLLAIVAVIRVRRKRRARLAELEEEEIPVA
jgi:hypothetical protein